MDFFTILYLDTTRGLGAWITAQMNSTTTAISANANSAARTNRIFGRGTMLSGVCHRLMIRKSDAGAVRNTGQNKRIGNDDKASAMVSYIVLRVSSVFDAPDWKHDGHTCRPSSS